MEAIQSGNFQVSTREQWARRTVHQYSGGIPENVRSLRDGNPFTVEPWMLRVPSALFGTLTVVGLFLLTRILTRSDFTAGATASFTPSSRAFGARLDWAVSVSLWYVCRGLCFSSAGVFRSSWIIRNSPVKEEAPTLFSASLDCFTGPGFITHRVSCDPGCGVAGAGLVAHPVRQEGAMGARYRGIPGRGDCGGSALGRVLSSPPRGVLFSDQ